MVHNLGSATDPQKNPARPLKSLLLILIPWSRALLEKLTGSQLVKKFPALYGTQRFITAFKIARHLSLD